MAAPSDDSDAPDDEGTSDTEDATSDGATPRTPSRLERLLSPAAARTDAPTTNAKGATTKWSVDRLDSRERMYGYVAGVAAVVFGVLIYAVDTNCRAGLRSGSAWQGWRVSNPQPPVLETGALAN